MRRSSRMRPVGQVCRTRLAERPWSERNGRRRGMSVIGQRRGQFDRAGQVPSGQRDQ